MRPECDSDQRDRKACHKRSWPIPCPKVTTREKVEKLLDRLSEEELAAEYQRLRQTVEGERTPDDLAELEQFSARASRGVLRHMAEDEEKASLSWEEFRP
jgi:hypothetical protein